MRRCISTIALWRRPSWWMLTRAGQAHSWRGACWKRLYRGSRRDTGVERSVQSKPASARVFRLTHLSPTHNGYFAVYFRETICRETPGVGQCSSFLNYKWHINIHLVSASNSLSVSRILERFTWYRSTMPERFRRNYVRCPNLRGRAISR